MDWDKLKIQDWIDIQHGFMFVVEGYEGGELVTSEEFDDVIGAKRHMEYLKLHNKELTNINLISVSKQYLTDFYIDDEYWADIERWERKEVK